jgi:hypothetical protein
MSRSRRILLFRGAVFLAAIAGRAKPKWSAGSGRKRLASDQDFLPGISILALSHYFRLRGYDRSVFDFAPVLRWYRNRWALLWPWAMVWWQVQAWASVYGLTGDGACADFVFELADWALDHQVGNGSFLIDYAPGGPSFLTGCVMEGLGDAWGLAIRLGDVTRATAYSHAWKKAFGFVSRLMVVEEDTFHMPEPSYAIGGIRQSPVNTYMRIDFAGHLIHALVKGAGIVGGGGNT